MGVLCWKKTKGFFCLNPLLALDIDDQFTFDLCAKQFTKKITSKDKTKSNF